MDKGGRTETSRRKACRPVPRRLIQLYAALLHNAYLRGFLEGKIYEGGGKYLCVPGLNCYSCPAAAGACPLGALQNALASAGHRAGWYAAGMLLLFGTLLGRTICGWLCPFGLVQELLHKIPTPKIRKNRITRTLSWLKYGVLGVFVLGFPLYFGAVKNLPVPGFCKYICPAGTLEGAVGHLIHPGNASMFDMLGILFTEKWVILLATGLASIFCFRSFCRFLCPLGAIYSLFSRFALVGVKVDPDRCNGCGACVRGCRMDVRHIGDRECIQCGECMEACAQGAISLKAGRITVRRPDTCSGDRSGRQKRGGSGRVIRSVAWVVLGTILVWFNFLDPSVRQRTQPENQVAAPVAESPESNVPTGYEVGCRLEDFTLSCYDGSEFHLADTRGKVVFINRWATWCTPCIAELPYFQALSQAFGDDVAVLAIHPNMTVEDPETFLEGSGFSILFATDAEGDPVKEIVGGSSTLPQTIVLNRQGEVIYNRVKSVTYELLESLYHEASE